MNDSSQARFITFYSYKGGTGRTMAMANVGWILASAGKNVLMIDWDFEAPGLHRYLHPFLRDPDLAESDGLIDFLLRFSASAVASGDGKAPSDPNWFRSYANLAQYAYSVDYPFKTTDGKKGSLDFVPAGRQDETYSVRINGFDWDRFYTAFGGGIFLEAVKEKLRTEYDYVLIDSRTGVADTAGVCTVQMPDDLVVCFTLNRQSILGSSAVARSAFAQRNRSTKGTSLRIWPVPTRIEDAEKEKRDREKREERIDLSETRTDVKPGGTKPDVKPDVKVVDTATPKEDKNVGYLTAYATPFAQVSIDGKPTGKTTPITPMGKIPLSPGIHKITFSVGREKFTYSVKIEAGKTSKITKDLPVSGASEDE